DPKLAPPTPAAPEGEAPNSDQQPAVAPGEGETPKPADPLAGTIPVDWKAKLEADDPEFLKEFGNHPKVKGFIAGQAGFLAKQQADAAARAAELSALDQAAQDDPDNPLARAHLAERATELQRHSELLTLTNSFQTAQAAVAAFVQSLPDETRAEIGKLAPEGKTYGEPGDLQSGLIGYMADVVKGGVAAEVEKAVEARFKAELPARFKDYLAQKGEAEPSPDLGSGMPGGGSALTPEKLNAMSPVEYRKLASTPAGQAQIDAVWVANVKQPGKG
ncbi:MAG: hypothetical protein ACRESF_17695, partial [Pseudomonas sp.]